MGYSKKGWDIVSEMIRLVGETGDTYLTDCDVDDFLKDIATIMDHMIGEKTFAESIVAITEENDDGVAWVEGIFDELDIKYEGQDGTLIVL